MNGQPITIEALERLGFKDQTGGWGGSQGMGWLYLLKAHDAELVIGQVDWTSNWVLYNRNQGGGFSHVHPIVEFSDFATLLTYIRDVKGIVIHLK